MGALEPAEVADELRSFVTARLGQDVGVDDDYFDLGLANSLFSLELVMFVENRFGLTVEVADLDLDNFRRISRIVGFVLARAATAGPTVR